MLQPIDGLAVELFLDSDVAHARGDRGPVPVPFTGREPDHVAGPDFLDRTALALRPAKAGRDDQGLAERMGVPSRARARFEGDERAGDAGWLGRAQERVDANRSGEILRRALAGGLRSAAIDLQDRSPRFTIS
jgi:hypothetical protein